MRHVQHQRGLARHDLEAPRQLHQRQARTHRLRGDGQALAQCLERGEHARGVDELVGPAQRRIRQPRVAPPASGPGPLLLVAGEVEVLPEAPQVGADLARVVDDALRRHGVAHHHRAARAHDAGLLAADGLAVGAEELDVVDVHAGDDGAVGVDDVGRVQAAAQAYLQDRHVQPRLAHQPQDGQRGEFEIAQRDFVAILGPGAFHRCEVRYQVRSGDGLAVDAAALLEMHQVRRGVDTRAVARLQRHGLQHGAGGTLAVGARHGDHGAAEGQAHAARDLAHAGQAHVDVLGVQPLAVGEPAFQGLGEGLHRAQNCRP